MIKKELFNLEKIKELMGPIDKLQGKLNQFEEISDRFIKIKNDASEEKFELSFNEDVNEIFKLVDKINKSLIKVTNNNLNKFIEFQNKLIEKYKKIFKDNLKQLKLKEESLQKIGFYLIENKEISKINEQISYIPSLALNQWLDILESLRENTSFLKTIKRMEEYFQKIIQERLEFEIDKIPKDVDINLLESFKTSFREDSHLTFKEFLQMLEDRSSKEEIAAKKEILGKAREKEELENLKKKQEEQQEMYKDYLTLSDKEFKRRRRKEKRKDLSKIDKVSKKNSQIEISQEVSEKIEKFKSQFDKTLKENYLIQKDEDKDPIELIRERKKRKTEEFKNYKKHFEKK